LKTGKLDRFMTELEVCFIFSIFFFCFWIWFCSACKPMSNLTLS
jgi:hypothetical protein